MSWFSVVVKGNELWEDPDVGKRREPPKCTTHEKTPRVRAKATKGFSFVWPRMTNNREVSPVRCSAAWWCGGYSRTSEGGRW